MIFNPQWSCVFYPSHFSWKRFLAALTHAAGIVVNIDNKHATVLSQHVVTAIAAVTIKQIYITVQLNQQQGLASFDSFECHLIGVVAIVATACCCFMMRLMHARLGRALSSFQPYFHREITTNRDATAGNDAPNVSNISTLTDDELAYDSQRPVMLPKQNRGGCDIAIFGDGCAYNVAEGDYNGGSILARTGAAATKNRIARLRERKGNLPSNGDANGAGDPLSEENHDGLKSSLSAPPAINFSVSEIVIMHPGSDPTSDKKIGITERFRDDSASEGMFDVEPVPLVIESYNGRLGSMPSTNPPVAVSISMSDGLDTSDSGTALILPSSKLPSPQPHLYSRANNNDARADGEQTLSSLTRAVIDLLPGSLPPTKSSSRKRSSRPLLNSQGGTFVSTLHQNGFWQSLSNIGKSQEVPPKSCSHHNIIEIMSVGGEDPVEQRILAKILVAGHGFGFCPMGSGESALEELKGRYNKGGKESFPILILVDTALSGMDGYETTMKIRTLFPDVALPIIMLTASSDLEITTFQSAVEAGANDLVTQPITKHNLMARIGCQLKTLHFWRGQLESRRNELLLNDILPKNIITKLKQGHAGCIYDELEEVSVIFTDIVSFTSLSASHPTEEIIHMLDSLFTEFDKLTDKHGLYKVETIGEKPFSTILPCQRCSLTL